MTEKEFLGLAPVTASDRAALDAYYTHCDMCVRRFLSSLAAAYRVLCEARQDAKEGPL